ncbi:MAG: hypothetical protein JW862_05630 [Anaerolineales bacterium]|nr:hypothetical protein [Anaerolineales bacterium]
MDPIQVKTRSDQAGNIIPVRFEWRGQGYLVESIGRRWQVQDDLHILVMVPGGRAFHLRLDASQQAWYLVRGSEIPTIPRI